MSDQDNTPQDEEVNAEFDPTMPAGVPEGTEIQTPNGVELVVHDLDDDGNVVGWHKEVKE